MDSVGYDMYLQLLGEAIAEEKGEAPPPKPEDCLIDIQVEAHIPENYIEIEGLVFSERVELIYAEPFAIDRYENGYSVIHTMNGESFLLVPEGKKTPDGLSERITVIEKPTKNIYLAVV